MTGLHVLDVVGACFLAMVLGRYFIAEGIRTVRRIRQIWREER